MAELALDFKFKIQDSELYTIFYNLTITSILHIMLLEKTNNVH
ncbi:hypothetical protein [Psychrilyobacter atlanticus]|nr:hypothetical protein [Psychrilyobacter atlanticus]